MSGQATYLTDNRISKLKYDQKGAALQRYWDAAQPGLHVVVYPSPKGKGTGRKTLSVRYDQDGRQKIKKVGTFPEISIVQARELAAKLRSSRSLPVTFKEAYNNIQQNIHRLPMGRNSASSNRAFEAGIRTHWMPVLKNIELDDIGEAKLLTVIDRAVERGRYGSAQSAFTTINAFYRNLRALNGAYRVQRNPLTEVYIPKFERKRTVFSVDELKALWSCGSSAIQFLMLTGQRMHQATELDFEQVGGDVIRFDHMKRKGSVHILPLTDSIRATLGERSDNHKVFSFDTKLPESHIRRVMRQLKIDGTPHMLRHTFATLGLENGLSFEGIARVLHHALPGQTAHYSRDAQALDLKRETLIKWDRYLSNILNISDAYT